MKKVYDLAEKRGRLYGITHSGIFFHVGDPKSYSLAKKFIKVLSKKGIVNIGGETNTIFKFAKKNNKYVKKIKSKGEFPLKMDMSLSRFKSLTRK